MEFGPARYRPFPNVGAVIFYCPFRTRRMAARFVGGRGGAMNLNSFNSSDSEPGARTWHVRSLHTSERRRTSSMVFSAREGGEANPVTSPCSSRPPLTEEQQPRMANGKRRAHASGELESELDGPSWKCESQQGAGKRRRTSPKYFHQEPPPSALHAARRA